MSLKTIDRFARMGAKRKAALAAAAAALAGLLAWLLLPLADSRFAISFDAAMIERKRLFLDGLRRGREGAPGGPNVVVILADDLGTQDISLYGGTVPTPRIDALAREGVTFTSAYCTAPICSPSRASLLTGRTQHRYGYEYQPMTRYPRNRLEYLVYRGLVNTGKMVLAPMGPVPRGEDIRRQGLPPSEITLAELLGSAGYRTGIVGKWHLGYEPPLLPRDFGFQSQYGFYEAFTLYAPADDPSMVKAPLDDFADRHQWSSGREGHCAIRRDGRVVKEDRYLTDAMAEEAVAFMENSRERPFFLYLSFNAPHVPFQAPRGLYGRAAGPDGKKRVYAAMISSLDGAVGRVVDAIDRLGLREKTIVVFASDNGAAAYTGAPAEGPLRFGKFSYYEGGIRVPMVMRWPGAARPGTVMAEPVSLMDVFPTAAAAARVPLPGDRPFDGKDLAPRLSGVAAAPLHEALCWRDGEIRVVRRGRWKLIADGYTGRDYLYDLSADPGETRNIAASRSAVVKELRAVHARWEKDAAVPPRWPHVMFYRFPVDGGDIRFPL